ncbi:zinc finger CCHC domain-containing protein 7 [Anoplopoma fimbria]|uniref:zinc finger CCHC domain-containing protein 7 n=1 Tax=Anoplopoma fimbria TaxID=229290 RepID=UPI0023EDF0C5|nr:zinc finger CCHC domain-containing protein 7 [Anoplopoma fimbria]XP_054460369.1 zinc finger CCHC domain-containing protein 7 [Anoplopoma fimbria]
MYCAYQDWKEVEDDLYQEDDGDSEGSEANSELEFHLYSQLHYSSNAGALEEQEDKVETAEGQDSQQPEAPVKTEDVDGEREQTEESRPPSPDLDKLLQYLKKQKEKKRQKLDKQKTVNPKGQRSSSSYIEEVIVIDSSPDVISISEDDDEGVCALKGRSAHRMQTSTPAPQRTQKRSLSAPVTVDSSSSGSGSEESESQSSSDSSDSDDLENWMLLGRGNQDGDHSISLNLEGGSDSKEDAEERESGWLVSSRDKEARIYNKDKGVRLTSHRMSNRYYTDKNVQCRNCSKNGHLSKNCPEPKKLPPCFLCGNPGHMASGCPNKHCNNCGLPGHLYNSCSERPYWNKRCDRCGMMGHFFDACPEIWRQYHITTKAGIPTRQRSEDRGRTQPQRSYCYNCSSRGHFGHVCTWQRNFNRTFPTVPFINRYDTRKDVSSTEKWIASKAKELKKNGFLQGSSQTPLTPGPPKKKQRVDHHNNHHYQANHTPRQSTNHHKRNHIFFNDDHVFGAAAPKTKKNNKPKQQKTTSNVKPWKPKRPVPASKDPLPKKAKLIVDEAQDFPRGGGRGEDMEKKKKKKKGARNRKKAPSAPPEVHREGRPDRLQWTVTGEMQGSESKQQKGKKNKKKRAKKNGNKNAEAQMYPTDENLFIIKQRKGRR